METQAKQLETLHLLDELIALFLDIEATWNQSIELTDLQKAA